MLPLKTIMGGLVLSGWLSLMGSVSPSIQSPASVTPLPAEAEKLHPPIPIRFTLPEDGLVTLVIEDTAGQRIRNLLSETPFSAGENTVWWDGTDDLLRNPEAYRHGLYHIPAQFVAPGTYQVRGLWHKPIDLRYEFSIYNAGTPAWETESGTGAWLANHMPPSAVLFVPEEDANQSPAAPCPGGVILAGSYISEGGHGLAWLDLQGHKRFGQLWVGGVWTGASHLVRDAGPERVSGVYAYTGAAYEGGALTAPNRSCAWLNC